MSVSMTISIHGQLLRTLNDISWQSGMNVQQAMEAAYGSEAGYSFAIQFFGPDLRYEAVILDNISQQAGADAFLFWELSVNGQISRVGIDETILFDGDRIEWNYTRYLADRHDETKYQKIRKAETPRSPSTL